MKATFTNLRYVLAVATLLAAVSACDETGSNSESLLEGEESNPSLSLLLHDAKTRAEVGTPEGMTEVEYWLSTVDKELGYAGALETYWTDSVREAVQAATGARLRAENATGLAREAAVAEARDVLNRVAWNEWTTTLISCVDDRISDDDVAQARDSRSGKDPAWQAQVRRADRLRNGADEAMRELEARRSLQRAFYACELASQVAGEPLQINPGLDPV